ncbi:hypothetical protein ACN2C6_09685 [Caulobacter sp. ErkDOM-YI]|uniref:hypothetical protein n=1 Tax=unclassified Caulobacter TaxID=2648921 RepID=UPI003AF55CD5
MPRSKTRALIRAGYDPETSWTSTSTKEFRARVQRLSFAITKRHIAEAAARQRALAAAHEKAPDLSTEGFNDLVIPAEEPRPPRMGRLTD